MKGTVRNGAELQVHAGTPVNGWGSNLEDGAEGIWLLVSTPPTWEVLVGGKRPDLRSVERLLAGLPRIDGPPDAAALRALAQRSDAVVYADINSTNGVDATGTTVHTIQGVAPPTFEVRAPDQNNEPGGPWRWYTEATSGSAKSEAVLFLQKDGTRWRAINPTDPYLYPPDRITELLNK